MFDNIFAKGAGLSGAHYCDLLLDGFGIAVAFGVTHPGQSIVTSVISFEDKSVFSVENCGILQGANFNQVIHIDRSKA